MNPFRIKSLQQRMVVFLLAPVAFLLIGMGFAGFLSARNVMLTQWREAATLKLQRAAHYMDMRLSRPIEWIEMLHETGGRGHGAVTPDWIIRQIGRLEGVAKVDLQWLGDGGAQVPMGARRPFRGRGRMRGFHHARISEVTSPHYNTQTGQETVSLISSFLDESNQIIGTLEVTLRFDYLMKDIRAFGWWQSSLACLIDRNGHYLAHSKSMKGRKTLGETGDPLETALLNAIRKKSRGTLLGPGHPPQLVAGYHRLEKAPWVIALFAPGEEILAPIVRFRFYYFLAGIFCILLITLMIRSIAGRMVKTIRDIAGAANRVAEGNYGAPLASIRHDEIGHLIQSFNTMVSGLKERDFIRNTFGRYVDTEIARDLMRRPEAARLGGEKREVAILMSDLRNFTPLSESLSPEETIRLLNHYFSHMITVIQRHGGIIVDFFGDELLVFFDPLDRPIEPFIQKAIRCALEMQAEILEVNSENSKRGLPRLEMGIAVNSGQVVVGNIGSDTRAKYGIVGAAVNLTHRIQALAAAGEVMVTESVYRRAPEGLSIERSFQASPKGVRESLDVFVIKGIPEVDRETPS